MLHLTEVPTHNIQTTPNISVNFKGTYYHFLADSINKANTYMEANVTVTHQHNYHEGNKARQKNTHLCRNFEKTYSPMLCVSQEIFLRQLDINIPIEA